MAALSRKALRSLWLAAPESLAEAGRRPGVAPDAVILDCAGCRDPGGPGSLSPLVERARNLAPVVLVWLSALDSGRIEAELHAIRPAKPDGVVLSACDGGPDVQQCGVKLGVVEAEQEWEAGSVAIIAAPSAAGFLALGGFRGSSMRLRGFALERPAAAGDASATAPAEFDDLLRTLLLLGARSAGVPAYGVLPPGLPAPAHRRGFGGLITRDRDAVAAINATFSAGA